MKNRVLRFTLHALFVGAVAAAAYVVWTQELEGAATARAARGFEERVRVVSRALLDLKSAQPGYVAAGQGDDFWTARVDSLLGPARDGLNALKPLAHAPQSRTEVDAAATAFEDFEQMDRRTREYVRNNQRLLASDLVFSDGIEKLDGAAAALERARGIEVAAADALVRQQRRQQLTAVAGAAAVGLLIMFALVPLPRPEPPAVVEPVAVRESIAPSPVRRPATVAPPAAPPVIVAPPPRPAPPAVDLPAIAALCTDLARVVDTRSLPEALERAAALMNASGLVIWVADPDGRELSPVMAHGYPNNLLSRMGTIARDAENATAAAFRTGLVQTVKADALSHGAIAAPLLTPAGAVGVMAAEVLQDGERRDATRATAAIVAAQLATLVGPPSARAPGKTEAAGA